MDNVKALQNFLNSNAINSYCDEKIDPVDIFSVRFNDNTARAAAIFWHNRVKDRDNKHLLVVTTAPNGFKFPIEDWTHTIVTYDDDISGETLEALKAQLSAVWANRALPTS